LEFISAILLNFLQPQALLKQAPNPLPFHILAFLFCFLSIKSSRLFIWLATTSMRSRHLAQSVLKWQAVPTADSLNLLNLLILKGRVVLYVSSETLKKSQMSKLISKVLLATFIDVQLPVHL